MHTEPDYSSIFHQSSKDLAKGHPPISQDVNDWPKEWRTVSYKTYPRLPMVILSHIEPADRFFQILRKRQTARNFESVTSMSLEEASLFLKYSCGNIERAPDGKTRRRAQASGGARFPIEVYAWVLHGDERIKPGLYHYNVLEHALDILWEKKFSDEEVRDCFVFDWIQEVNIVFFMTAVFQRTQMKYGERGYRYILIEAGHIGQNMYLVAEALGLKCCALGGTHDEKIERLLDIDGTTESLVYAVAVGH